MAEEKLMTFSVLCILSGVKKIQLIKIRTNNSVSLPKLPLQGGQCILVHNVTITKLRNCGFCFACVEFFQVCQFRIIGEKSGINAWTQADQTIRASLTGSCQAGPTSIQEDDLFGYASTIRPVHERREVDTMNNIGSD